MKNMLTTYPEDYQDFCRKIPEIKIYVFIFQHILKIDVPAVGCGIFSPLRDSDKGKPSFFLYTKNNAIKWKDHGLANPCGNNALSLYQEIVGKKGRFFYRIAMNDLWDLMCDPNITIDEKAYQTMARSKQQKATQCGLEYDRVFKHPEHYEYWRRHKISKELLAKFDVYHCPIAWFDTYVWHKSSKKDPMYVYIFSRKPEKWQLYRPLTRSKKNKHRAKNPGDVVMGWDLLPESGPVCFITKSYKDVICLTSMGLPATGMLSETSMHLLPQSMVEDLKKRFKKVIVFLDNDDTGIQATKLMTDKYPWMSSYTLPPLLGDCKDASDVIYDKHDNGYGQEYLAGLLWRAFPNLPIKLSKL